MYNNISWPCSYGSRNSKTCQKHGVGTIQWYFQFPYRSKNPQIFHEFIGSLSGFFQRFPFWFSLLFFCPFLSPLFLNNQAPMISIKGGTGTVFILSLISENIHCTRQVFVFILGCYKLRISAVPAVITVLKKMMIFYYRQSSITRTLAHLCRIYAIFRTQQFQSLSSLSPRFFSKIFLFYFSHNFTFDPPHPQYLLPSYMAL